MAHDSSFATTQILPVSTSSAIFSHPSAFNLLFAFGMQVSMYPSLGGRVRRFQQEAVFERTTHEFLVSLHLDAI
jgi:hypothetical protein